jgi:hypothetical protein
MTAPFIISLASFTELQKASAIRKVLLIDELTNYTVTNTLTTHVRVKFYTRYLQHENWKASFTLRKISTQTLQYHTAVGGK